MAKVSTNITIDSDTKAKAQELFADFGLDLSTAINIFLRQAIRENAIPFPISRKTPPDGASVRADGAEDDARRLRDGER